MTKTQEGSSISQTRSQVKTSSAPVNNSVLMKGEIPFIDPVMFENIVLFENIDETTISKAALSTKGAAGPSGVNADGWRRILFIEKLW